MLNELNAANSPKAENSADEKRVNQQNDVTEEELRFRIAKDGKDIGEMKSSEIRQHLSQGSLSPNDYYWNVEQNAWVNLSNFHH